MIRESWAPCHAIGDWPCSSTTRRAPGIAPAYASPTASGWPGSGSSRSATTTVGTSIARELVELVERPRARHDAQRVGDRLGMLVRGQALADDPEDRLAPARVAGRLAVGGDEALDAAFAQPVAERVPARAATPGSPCVRRVVGGRDHDEAGDALGLLEREAQGGVRAHRRAGEHRALDARARRAPREVGGEVVVVVGAGLRRGVRLAVAAGVVGDDAVPGALQRARAHHDIAVRGGEPVKQHDRGALPVVLDVELHAGRIASAGSERKTASTAAQAPCSTLIS